MCTLDRIFISSNRRMPELPALDAQPLEFRKDSRLSHFHSHWQCPLRGTDCGRIGVVAAHPWLSLRLGWQHPAGPISRSLPCWAGGGPRARKQPIPPGYSAPLISYPTFPCSLEDAHAGVGRNAAIHVGSAAKRASLDAASAPANGQSWVGVTISRWISHNSSGKTALPS